MNKVVFITGASGVIGRDIAIEFGRKGYSVAIGYNQNISSAKELKELLEKNNISSEIFCFNAENFSESENVSKLVYEHFGRIDVLINNAGVSHYGLFSETDEADYQKIIGVNLGGAIAVTKGAMPYLLKNGGVILNISSIWGISGAAGEVLYSTTKAGLIGFTKALAKETAKSRIRVNCIAPGAIMSPMMENFSKEEIDSLVSEIPLGRLGTGQDVAALCLFLASSGAEYITGQVFSPNGGMVI